jgi:hypothetical protein
LRLAGDFSIPIGSPPKKKNPPGVFTRRPQSSLAIPLPENPEPHSPAWTSAPGHSVTSRPSNRKRGSSPIAIPGLDGVPTSLVLAAPRKPTERSFEGRGEGSFSQRTLCPLPGVHPGASRARG